MVAVRQPSIATCGLVGKPGTKMNKTMLVKAVKVDGGYILDADGCRDYDHVRTSRSLCYKAAEALWPYSSAWAGRKVKGGYRINID
jgi:hypothetical protein